MHRDIKLHISSYYSLGKDTPMETTTVNDPFWTSDKACNSNLTKEEKDYKFFHPCRNSNCTLLGPSVNSIPKCYCTPILLRLWANNKKR